MKYELLYILSPKFTEEEIKKTHQKNLELLKPYITKIISEDFWGKKRLAYKIKQFQDGYYILTIFETEPAKIKEIDRKLKLQEEVVRFLLTKQEYEYKKKEVKGIKKEKRVKLEEIKPEKPKEKKKISVKDLDKKLDEILGEEIVN